RHVHPIRACTGGRGCVAHSALRSDANGTGKRCAGYEQAGAGEKLCTGTGGHHRGEASRTDRIGPAREAARQRAESYHRR
ncbi:hypothetical protein SB717_36080, partial [Priestia sp. SIMBA_032]|uniref:hypothetical protein n=1 Tax=Priestia sp. SIMBA_032 TaxID=3085775 RepID=UPI003979FFFE